MCSIVLAQSDKSKLESRRVSLWSGSISSTATRPAFWPGSTGTHVMPQLHKRFSFPPDKLVTVSDIPSVRQTHPASISEHRKSVKNVLINPPFQFSKFHICFPRISPDPGKDEIITSVLDSWDQLTFQRGLRRDELHGPTVAIQE